MKNKFLLLVTIPLLLFAGCAGQKVVRELKEFQYPVYIDYEGLFRKANPQIPSDERFHSFLLDKNMRPVFVGNPVAGQELWRLFMTICFPMEVSIESNINAMEKTSLF